MGWFDWLLGPSGPLRASSTHRIWLTEQALLHGLVADVRDCIAESEPVLLTAHFDEDLGALVEVLQQSDLGFRVWQPPAGQEQARRELAEAGSQALLTPATALPSWESESSTALQQTHPCVLMAFQHHPLTREDQRILEFAAGVGINPVEFHASLDHPLFVRMVGKQFSELMRSLGMKEDEAIEHAIITRQIEPIQRRIAARVSDLRHADSCAEWFERNYDSAG